MPPLVPGVRAMHHMAAYSYLAANTGAGVFVNMAAIADSFVTTNANNRHILPSQATGQRSPWKIVGGYAQGASMTVARVFNATLRNPSLPSIVPTAAAAAVPSLFPVLHMGMQGPPLKYADEFGIEQDSAAAEQHSGFLWIGDGNLNISTKPITACQFTSTITAVANTWTSGPFTLAQGLPGGRYQVVGMDVVGAGVIGARLAFPFAGPRPGCLGRATLAVLPNPYGLFRNGNMGVWGEFDSYAQPQLDLFVSGAGAVTVTGWLDLIQLVEY